MTNKEKTKIAIEYLTELRDSRQKVLPNEAPYYEAEKDMDIFNSAIKALEDEMPIESITTKGGMTLSLKKIDIEISDLARCIAMALKDTTVEELANNYNMLTFIDNNSGKTVSYRRVDGEEEKNDTLN